MTHPPAPGWPPMPVRPAKVPRPVPHPRWTLALVLVGLAIVLACFFLLPWAKVGDEWISVPDIWDVDGPAPDYLRGMWLAPLLPGSIAALGGALDSKVCRILFLIAGILASLGGWFVSVFLVLLTGVVGASGLNVATPDGGQVAFLGVLFAMPFVFGMVYVFTRGLGCRIMSGLILIVAAVVHAGGAHSVLEGGRGTFEAGAYAATFGYLLCAVGAFVGPGYRDPAPTPFNQPYQQAWPPPPQQWMPLPPPPRRQ